MANKKPLLFGDEGFDFERFMDSEEKYRTFDMSYVPGYSERRRDNELRVRDGKEPIPGPRFQWIRVSDTHGNNVRPMDMMSWYRLGYRPASRGVLEDLSYDVPPAAFEAEDGLIRRDDLALFYVDEETARKNKEKRQRDLEHQSYAHSDYDDETETEKGKAPLAELAEMDLRE